MKAMGYTKGQLTFQTAAGFLPVIVLSAVAGLAVCAGIINPLTAFFLRGIGIVECIFTVPLGMIAGAGMVVLTFGIACCRLRCGGSARWAC